MKGGTLLQCDAGGGAETSLEVANPKISHPNSWSGHGFMSWNGQAVPAQWMQCFLCWHPKEHLACGSMNYLLINLV